MDKQRVELPKTSFFDVELFFNSLNLFMRSYQQNLMKYYNKQTKV